ncbi:unnamed protein product [Brassica rapa subsp. trilocularis]
MSSSRPEQHTLHHFIHIHPLTKVDGYGEFTCGGCKTFGFGKTYRCSWCDYNLHEHCATCSPTLFSFIHPQHELKLVFRGPEQTHHEKRMCNICDEPAEGLFYQCHPCGFDVHPLCTQLPQRVRHVPHSAHPLELSHWGASSTCKVCSGAIRSWRYKCSPCGLDVHMECVNTSAASVATIQQRCYGPQPHYHPSQYYHPYYNHGYTNHQGQMSSLKLEQEVLQHFTHVHPLTKVYDFGGFICNGCNTYGSGKTYRCASCNYDLHDCCATCPRTLHCFVHPQHELTLVFKEPAKMDHDRRGCNICHELAEGLYYQCEACGFDMHPLCSQLPQQVSHMSHPAHYLELSDHGASNMCMECHGVIRSWRYKCGPCRLDVHMECQPQPYFQPCQYQLPCRSTNQGQPQGQQSGRSAGKKMFGIFMALTIGVASDVIAETAHDAFFG